MRNRTIMPLDGSVQHDDPNRNNYIRRDHPQIDPAIKDDKPSWQVVSVFGGIGVTAVLILWLILWVNRWAACRNGVDMYCAISDPIPFLYPILLLVGGVWYLAWMWQKSYQRSRAEIDRASITRDPYDNPVPVGLLHGMTWAQYMGLFSAREIHEDKVAQFKTYTGLEVYSPSISYSNKVEGIEDSAVGPDAPTIVPVSTWLPWLTDEAIPHLLVIGKTRSGKSTLGDIVLGMRANRGDKIAILDPHWSSQDKYGNKKWGGIPPLAKSLDEVPPVLAALKNEYTDRYRRMQLPADDPEFVAEMSFDPITVLIDEVPEIIQHLGPHSALWKSTVQIFGSGGAKVNINAIMLSQSPNVEDVGMNAKMRENFCTIALANMARPFIELFKIDKTIKMQLYTLLTHSSSGITKPAQLPAAAERDGAVSILSRDGILDYRETKIDAVVWTPTPTRKVSESAGLGQRDAKNDDLLSAFLGAPTPAETTDSSLNGKWKAESAEIRRRRTAGESYEKIEKEMGVSSKTIAKAMKEDQP